MTTDYCSACAMIFRLDDDGMVRVHHKQNGGLCPGSRKPPGDPRSSPFWTPTFHPTPGGML